MKLRITDPITATILQQLRSHYAMNRLSFNDLYIEMTDLKVSALAECKTFKVTRNKTVEENGWEYLLTVEETYDFVTWIEEGEEAGVFVDKFELRPTGETETNRTKQGRIKQDLGWMEEAPEIPDDEKPAIVLS